MRTFASRENVLSNLDEAPRVHFHNTCAFTFHIIRFLCGVKANSQRKLKTAVENVNFYSVIKKSTSFGWFFIKNHTEALKINVRGRKMIVNATWNFISSTRYLNFVKFLKFHGENRDIIIFVLIMNDRFKVTSKQKLPFAFRHPHRFRLQTTKYFTRTFEHI